MELPEQTSGSVCRFPGFWDEMQAGVYLTRAGAVPAAEFLLVLRLLLGVDAHHFSLGGGFCDSSEIGSADAVVLSSGRT